MTSLLLECLGIKFEDLATLSAKDQFAAIRAAFLKEALASHPDKDTGSPEAFCAVKDAFESLKRITACGESCLDPSFNGAGFGFKKPSSSFSAKFYTDCYECVPSYCANAAKNSLSKCTVCCEKILEGSLRFGSLNAEAGQFGRWSHSWCMRVPSVVHAYLPSDLDAEAAKSALLAMNGLTIEGLLNLNDVHLDELVAAVCRPDNWAKTTKRKAAEIASNKRESVEEGLVQVEKAYKSVTDKGFAPTTTAKTVVVGALAGKVLVLTGVFDEPGGVGLAAGKESLSSLIASAGGKVTSAISKKTSYLVVGHLPGASKVSKAQELNLTMVTVKGLDALLSGDKSKAPEKADVTNVTFSSGFGGNAVSFAPRLTGPSAEAPAKRICP